MGSFEEKSKPQHHFVLFIGIVIQNYVLNLAQSGKRGITDGFHNTDQDTGIFEKKVLYLRKFIIENYMNSTALIGIPDPERSRRHQQPFFIIPFFPFFYQTLIFVKLRTSFLENLVIVHSRVACTSACDAQQYAVVMLR